MNLSDIFLCEIIFKVCIYFLNNKDKKLFKLINLIKFNLIFLFF